MDISPQEEEEEEERIMFGQGKKCVLSLTALLVLGVMFGSISPRGGARMRIREKTDGRHKIDATLRSAAFPPELLEESVYSSQDFVNQDGISPVFWTPDDMTNCTDNKKTKCAPLTTWGPCYPPSKKENNWKELIQISRKKRHHGGVVLRYPTKPRHPDSYDGNPNPNLAGYCRPGFIIIGAGKCGTSSLYHYITGHPRVLPASEKQIHYFKYHAMYNTKWYLSHFPTTASFLSSGALMTGEASPGYLPYPDVAHMVSKRMPGPKLVAIGREPLDRTWSSYKYNYVIPALTYLRKGHQKGVPKGQSDEYYQPYLFSFDQMVRAELGVLKTCLAPGGPAVVGAQQEWGKKSWAKEEYKRRQDEGLPPLVDLDKYCYGKPVSRKVPRPQWTQLVEEYPEKVITLPNLHLVQALIGRSLYALPLEWWYATQPRGSSNVYFMCTEELKDTSGEPLNRLGMFLGLPSFDFSDVVSQGMYNVGYNKGYDTATTWDEAEQKEHGDNDEHNGSSSSTMPLSDEVRQELLEFVKPFNERLFELTGKRCDW